jgi:NitT/TauT family transport system ATP-binding protein
MIRAGGIGPIESVASVGPASQPEKVVIRALCKRFTGKPEAIEVLRAIDLTVRAGEFVCLIGPSGCGKSTLLNILGGFETPSTGSVLIDGEVVRGPHPRRVLVFQECGLFPWASVWDNIALGLHGKDEDEQTRIVRHYVDVMGLNGFELSYPSEISGGMRQRVTVARALAVSPDVIFMDEPLGALDSLTRLAMRAEILRIWRKERPTILFVTHDVDEALQLADRIVVMSSRPCRIAATVHVAMPHPRDFGSPEFARAKKAVLELLGVRRSMSACGS